MRNHSSHQNGILTLKIIVDLLNGNDIQLILQTEKISFDIIFRISKEGKVLSAFSNFITLFPENLRPYLERRCKLTKLYLEHLRIVSGELKRVGVEHYIFKTCRPFPYDLTDIDVLLVDRKAVFKAAETLIKNLGFKVISKGTYSLTLRKSINGFDIDVDLQPGIYAGTFNYFPILVKRKMVDISQNMEGISLLKPELELAIIAGHVIFKDFSISLADILYLDHLLKVSKDNVFSFISNDYPYLMKSVKIMKDIVNIFKLVIMGYSSNDCITCTSRLLLKSLLRQFNEGKGIFTIPFIISFKIYLEAFFSLVKRRDYKRLLGLILLPKSKGIKILFRRFNFLSE